LISPIKVGVNDVTVTAAKKIIKNSHHSYVRNVLHFKLVKLQSVWKSGSSRIGKINPVQHY